MFEADDDELDELLEKVWYRVKYLYGDDSKRPTVIRYEYHGTHIVAQVEVEQTPVQVEVEQTPVLLSVAVAVERKTPKLKIVKGPKDDQR